MLKRILVAAVLATASFIGNAAPVLDQSYDPFAAPTGVLGGFNLYSSQALSQTFTVGTSGQLTSVDVMIRRALAVGSTTLFLDVRNTTVGGLPVSNDSGSGVLASVSFPSDSLSFNYAFFSVDLSSFNLDVTAGDLLAIALRTPDQTAIVQWAGELNPSFYVGGSAYFRSSPVWQEFSFQADLGFRTFVDAASVPEPSALFLLPVAMVGAVIRRRKARSDLAAVSGRLAAKRPDCRL
jgi:hypothetical protein